ncbi:alpha-mannosidase 2c1 [candidate division LCP-89 bacterium B3_LCP]|uniref:alpha-mannosidase n=1 Tax=candidate division LCP-89 bacterium B3_LCP TaxID=2012998 RepID=A0A532USK2_UNCL8|nr:MAG: alpha-mannosidase 2c1 [candidate division LCP-89 bacterium B3_LCP]
MNPNEAKIRITRIPRFIDRIVNQIIKETIPFSADFAWCKTPVPFSDISGLKFQPIKEGDVWGQAWESAWFHLKGKVPDSWKGQKIVARLDFSGEGLVYSGDGRIIHGITNGSVFKEDFARDIVHLLDTCKGGEKVGLWIETAANGLFGLFTEPDPASDSANRYGHFEAKVNSIKLCTFDDAIWALWLDLKVLNELVNNLPEKSVRRARIIRTVNEAIDIYNDSRESVDECREVLKQILDIPATSSDLSVTAIGHAHIDTAWLWPVQETIRKCARTFSNQIALLDKYPDYVFGASQPQHYAFVKQHYPDLYEKIKEYVKQGRWEPQGGMWVEADCNITSGESLIRQILHGKNFFKDEFGVNVDNCWLPDVFGFSASLPQILRKSGIDFFLTQKLSWNQVNEFPHHTFKWRGIDGSEVIAHFPPENNYNSQLGPDFLVPAQERFKEKGFLDEFLSLFGVGDGGGGPKAENIEMGLRQHNIEGSPKVNFGKADVFFHRLEEYKDGLETWVGELYFELHRGTLTSQTRTKTANRQLESRLRAVEFLWSCLSLDEYPADQLDAIWKKVLINQFHDILPGSSITKVYAVTKKEQREALRHCDTLLDKAAERLFDTDSDSLVLFNCLHNEWSGVVSLPPDWKDCLVRDDSGNHIPVQLEDEKLLALVSIPPYGFRTLTKYEGQSIDSQIQHDLVLENDLVQYEFDSDGKLIKAYDKRSEREILAAGKAGNVLTLYDDHPNDWDAWDIACFYEKHIIDRAKSVEVCKHTRGDVCQVLQFTMKIGQSNIMQKIVLPANSCRLDFRTKVDWNEKHKMLRVAFPVNIRAEQASFDIQYGYVKRNTHRNTSWDQAKFEVAAHRYADLSDNNYGVALLNDCKYGYKVHDNIIDLNLLRAPTYPDPDADQGSHEFTYSLLPHDGDLIHADVIQQAAQLNHPLIIFSGYKAKSTTAPWKLEGDGLSLEAVKKAEKEDCLILRIVETKGCHSSGKLSVADKQAMLVETSLMEWEDDEVITCDKTVELNLKPFEIRTYKVRHGISQRQGT